MVRRPRSREVLHVITEETPQVLDEPVEQRRKMQRIPRRPGVVVGARVGGGAILPDAPVAGAGQGEEHRRPERLAVRGGVGLPDRPGADLAAGQVRGVLAAFRRAVLSRRPGREHVAAYPGVGDFVVQFGDELVQVGRVLPVAGGLVPEPLCFGALLDPPALVIAGGVRLDDRFGLEVPAFLALCRPQRPGPFRARRAHAGEGVPAGHQHLLYLAGVEVGAAQLHRPDARTVLDGQVLDDVTGQRHRQPLSPRRPGRAFLGHWSPPSVSSPVHGSP